MFRELIGIASSRDLHQQIAMNVGGFDPIDYNFTKSTFGRVEQKVVQTMRIILRHEFSSLNSADFLFGGVKPGL
jgi:hypothetical protein